jgi:tetratricopeptide (TPR) repeat protein
VRRSGGLAAVLIAAATCAVYAPVRLLPFLLYDDQDYVTENAVVQAGLHAEGVRWAFTTFHASNWHPLTWLSHMADVSLFGPSAVGPHVENACLHALNAVLVFLLLTRWTGATGRACLAALLFALHPQHVESVAWVAERKDLLCALFALSSLLAWERWVHGGSRVGYLAAVLCMALGLLAKPMLVSLPLLLLVLDWHPFARQLRARLLAEKLPFVLLAFGSSFLTLRAQVTAMQLALPLVDRLANAAVALVTTLGQSLVPLGLAALYPHPGQTPVWEVALAFGAIAGVSALAFALRRRAPYLAAGWLWFALALGPTLGLVQVGFQSHADRYAYLPQIGVVWAVVWGGADLLARVRAPRWAGPLLGGVAAVTLVLITRAQLAYWRNDLALWERVVAVTGPNYFAETELAIELTARGRIPEALTHFARALDINPRWPRAEASYGFALFLADDSAAALTHFGRAFALEPNPSANTEWHVYYAHVLADVGRPVEAAAEFEKQLALDSADRSALLGLAELRATQSDPAVRDGAEALRLAREACLLAQCELPAEVDVLALAVAAAGDPAAAATLDAEALSRAQSLGMTALAARIERNLAVLREGRALTEAPR